MIVSVGCGYHYEADQLVRGWRCGRCARIHLDLSHPANVKSVLEVQATPSRQLVFKMPVLRCSCVATLAFFDSVAIGPMTSLR